MKLVEEPQVFLVACTSVEEEGIDDYLKSIQSPDWTPEKDVSDGETLIEMGGRMCYRSWQPYDENKSEGTNKNVKKVRKGNKKYIKNVLESKHGSLLEHVSMTFIFKDISRVLSHQLVRHRAGMAYSQESLRYVRLDELKFWIPEILLSGDDIESDLSAIDSFKQTINYFENIQSTLQDIYDIDNIEDFNTKKKLTSAFRRFAPIGLATSIMVTGNLRAWRHILEMRSSEHAEEEIRLVMKKVGKICKEKYPNVFQDMTLNDNNEWIFENTKV